MGNKHWANTWTEVEDLGGGKFAAEIHVGHRVFKDKVDGQYKKHKLTDERPNKDYVLIQSAKCCVEVYPYYAKYFDVNHEEVRLHEERWIVQRLFKEPNNWKDVDAYNPVISVEEYSGPAGDVVKVTITYDTDYGELIVEYFQRDGNALKHNVIFKNTSGSTETFRVLQKWAGIVGSKCNGKDIPVVEDTPYLAFHDSDKPKKKFNIAENLYSMVFNPDGSEKTGQCLQRPISIETHAQGMKADFIYGNWILAQDKSLEIDPDTATLDDPTEDGVIADQGGPGYRVKFAALNEIEIGGGGSYGPARGYVEWDVESIPDGATITDTIFKYHCQARMDGVDCHIHEMLGARPSTAGNDDIWDEIGEGTVYAEPAGFPEVGTNKQVDLGSSADTDLQSQLTDNWFAIGIQMDDEEGYATDIISSEEYAEATPPPTLYVEYSVGVTEFEYVGSGSFAFSGTATQSHTKEYLTTTSGQFAYSGSADQVYSKNYLFEGSGALAFSGDAIIIFGLAYVGSGSLAYSGEAVVTYTLNYLCTAIGELIYSGEAIFSYLCNFLFSGSGELAYSGEAEQSYTYNFSYIASGQFTYSGVAICEYTIAGADFEYVGTGSFAYSGTAIQSYTFNYFCVGTGTISYSGSATQAHTRYYLYVGSGDFTYSGNAITTIGFAYIGDGELIYAGAAEYSYQVGADFEYVGSGTFVTSGSGSYYCETPDWEYIGNGVFIYSGKAFHRWGDWAEIEKEESDPQEVTKETSDFTGVGKEESNWDKIDKEKGDWEKTGKE